MRIIDKSDKKCYSKYKYDTIENTFYILDDSNNVVSEIIPNVNLDCEHNPQNFSMQMLNNERKDCTENSIFQVYIDNQRVGWIFPIQAIRSNEHNYADNQYFLKYAYVAWDLLIRQLNIDVNSLEEFDLFAEYPEGINLLILDKENCAKVKQFEFDKYIVGLYQKGYSISGKGNLYAETIERGKRLNIKRQATELDDIPYLSELFKKQIPRETNDISRFYLYYQVIEILISKVFDKEFTLLVNELQSSTEKLFDKKEDLSRITNEKWRVKKLCNNYCSVDTYIKKSLNDKCIDMLKYTNCKVYENMEENLYQVRCLMVHRMYILDEKAEKILSDINDIFLELIIQLVITYKSNFCDTSVGTATRSVVL